MIGFAEEIEDPEEAAFAAASPDPLRDLERKTLARIRFSVCFQDAYLGRHLRASAVISLRIAKALGLKPKEQENLWYAASVHDIGKIGINPLILKKEGNLTETEFSEIQSHTILGHQMLQGIDSELYRTCADVALCHHERWDGGGYPNGKKGTQISLFSRIVSIADVYECITSGRHYREAKSEKEAIQELQTCAGSQFDPELIELFTTQVAPVKQD
ncbi:HD-GYP domain-containing protein [Puniceicoccus vermicola]|nr:HD domain-containing phosphohydrolase [Puniceicoccus vermicola]